jgi:hypothetical protein
MYVSVERYCVFYLLDLGVGVAFPDMRFEEGLSKCPSSNPSSQSQAKARIEREGAIAVKSKQNKKGYISSQFIVKHGIFKNKPIESIQK